MFNRNPLKLRMCSFTKCCWKVLHQVSLLWSTQVEMSWLTVWCSVTLPIILSLRKYTTFQVVIILWPPLRLTRGLLLTPSTNARLMTPLSCKNTTDGETLRSTNQNYLTPPKILPEASIGLRVLSLPASVRQSVRPSVTKFVRAITQHPFKLGSPNLDHRCKYPYCFLGWLTMTFNVKFNFKVKIYPILSLSAR